MKIVFTPALWHDRPVPIAPKRESERDQDLKIALTPALWRDRPVPIAPERGSERDFHVPIAPERGSARDRDWPVAPERESERDISAKSRQNARVNAISDGVWRFCVVFRVLPGAPGNAPGRAKSDVLGISSVAVRGRPGPNLREKNT